MAENAVKTPKKKKTRRIILIAVLAVVILAALLLPRLRKSKAETAQLAYDDTTVLVLTELENAISATGRVESADRTSVYSTSAYPVQEVLVEVGDTVTEGQLLAQLDGSTLEKQIKSQSINLKNAQASSQIQLENAQNNLDNFKDGLDQGLNTTLLSAKSQVQNAYDGYTKAKDALDRYQESLDLNNNTAILTAENNYKTAKTAREGAYDAFFAAQQTADDLNEAAQKARQALDAGLGNLADYEKAKAAQEAAEAQTDAALKALENANNAYDIAEHSFDAALRSVDTTLADYQSAVDSAYRAYQTACSSLAAAEKAIDEQLSAYENSVKAAEIGASTEAGDESMRQLEEELEKTKVKAPCGGTVTAVYATVGGSGAGLLFIIEDTEHLIVETSVKGYDMGSVTLGTQTVITSDSVKGAKFDGSVTKLAPTSNKTAMGTTDTMGDPAFAAEVTIDGSAPGLLIGMEAQLDFIVAHEENVWVVPYDAVYQNAAGQTVVLAAEETAANTWTLCEIPVTTGVDNDIDIVVSGDGLKEGLRIVNEPEGWVSKVGTTVSIVETAAYDPIAAMMEMGGF